MTKCLQKLILGATAAISLLFAPSAAVACSCQNRPTPPSADEYRQWLNDFDGVVFSGTAVRIEAGALPPFTKWTAIIAVERHWKGGTTPNVEIVTADAGICGMDLARGRRYLLALTRDANRALRAEVCSTGWFLTKDEAAFRAALGDGTPPPQ